MGVTAFEQTSAQCGFEYQWEFANSSGAFGVELLRSWTVNNYCGLSYSQTSILYIQTWQCDPPYVYFNLTTELCQDLCGGYYIENPATKICQRCTNPLCYQCLPSNGSLCTECATFNRLELVDNYTCACLSGYFLVPAPNQCTSTCGDGFTAAGTEACDDGNNNDGDGCNSLCQL